MCGGVIESDRDDRDQSQGARWKRPKATARSGEERNGGCGRRGDWTRVGADVSLVGCLKLPVHLRDHNAMRAIPMSLLDKIRMTRLSNNESRVALTASSWPSSPATDADAAPAAVAAAARSAAACSFAAWGVDEEDDKHTV